MICSEYRAVFNWLCKVILDYIGFALLFFYHWSWKLPPLSQPIRDTRDMRFRLKVFTLCTHWLLKLFFFFLTDTLLLIIQHSIVDTLIHRMAWTARAFLCYCSSRCFESLRYLKTSDIYHERYTRSRDFLSLRVFVWFTFACISFQGWRNEKSCPEWVHFVGITILGDEESQHWT